MVEHFSVVNPGTVRLGRLILAYVYILHIVGCAFWYIGSYGTGFCDDAFEECGVGWSLSRSDIDSWPLNRQ